MIHDFTITDFTPRPGHPSYWDAMAECRVYCVGHKVYDAHGERLYYVQWCDDETGEIRRVDVGDDPHHPKYKIDPATHRVVMIHERRPAPLRVVEMKPGESYFDG